MEKFVKGEELENPSRYTQNAIEAWDFAIQSLFPYPLGVVSKYVIRHKHKGGKQDLENITSKLEDEGYFNDSIDWVIRSLERMIEG
jgi:hypothetical protein